jgi:hypothetical protein
VRNWWDNADWNDLTLDQIAEIIYEDWGEDMGSRSIPHVEGVSNFESVDEWINHESGASMVAYFLSNAKEWKGVVAVKVKKHLQTLLDNIDNKK